MKAYLPTILWKKTINNISNNLFLTTNKVYKFEREKIKQHFSFETYDSFFNFDGKYYTEIDSFLMGSNLGLTLANAFLRYVEKRLLLESCIEYLWTVYKRYVR